MQEKPLSPRTFPIRRVSSGGWTVNTVIWGQVTVCTTAITLAILRKMLFINRTHMHQGKYPWSTQRRISASGRNVVKASTNIDVPFSWGWARVSTWEFMLSRTMWVVRLMQQQHIQTKKSYECKEYGNVSCVCSAFVPSNISRSKDSHTLIAKYVGIPFVTAVFSLIMWGFSQETFPQERFSQECTKCSECGKTFTHSYLSGLIGSMLEKNPLSIRISESLSI